MPAPSVRDAIKRACPVLVPEKPAECERVMSDLMEQIFPTTEGDLLFRHIQGRTRGTPADLCQVLRERRIEPKVRGEFDSAFAAKNWRTAREKSHELSTLDRWRSWCEAVRG
ncbi:hypothetical protein ES703_88609 [subsurface metagenome]